MPTLRVGHGTQSHVTRLARPGCAAEYLAQVLAEKDSAAFPIALKDVVHSGGGMTELAGHGLLSSLRSGGVRSVSHCFRKPKMQSVMKASISIPLWRLIFSTVVLFCLNFPVSADDPQAPGRREIDVPIPSNETAVVIYIDLTRVDLTAIRSIVRLLPSEPALADALRKVVDRLNRAKSAGAEGIGIKVQIPDLKKQPIPQVRIDCREGADTAVLENIIRDEPSLMVDGWVLSKTPHGLLLGQPDAAKVQFVDRERFELFTEAYQARPLEPITVVFVPTDEMRATLKSTPPPNELSAAAKEAYPALSTMKWSTVGAWLAPVPGLRFTLNAADDASADQVIRGLNDLIAKFQQSIEQGTTNNDPARLSVFRGIIDGLKPTRTGTQVTVEMKGPGLALVTAVLLPSLAKARDKANKINSAASSATAPSARTLTTQSGTLPTSEKSTVQPAAPAAKPEPIAAKIDPLTAARQLKLTMPADAYASFKAMIKAGPMSIDGRAAAVEVSSMESDAVVAKKIMTGEGKAYATLGMAQSLESAKQTVKAAERYEQIIQDFPETLTASVARRKLEALKVTEGR